MKPPILIDVALMINAKGQIDPVLLPALAKLNQADRPLVLIAERPDGWKPTRSRVDLALQQQQDLEATINRGGGMLDAVLYLEFSLFTRKRHRMAALTDLADRYDRPLDQIHAIVPEQSRMTELLQDTDVQVYPIQGQHELQDRISTILSG